MSTKFCGQLRVRHHNEDDVTHDYIFDMKKFVFKKGDDDSDNLLIVEVDEETSMLRMLADENKSLQRRLSHLLESDYISSFDELDPRTHKYKRDIKEADELDTVPDAAGQAAKALRLLAVKCNALAKDFEEVHKNV